MHLGSKTWYRFLIGMQLCIVPYKICCHLLLLLFFFLSFPLPCFFSISLLEYMQLPMNHSNITPFLCICNKSMLSAKTFLKFDRYSHLSQIMEIASAHTLLDNGVSSSHLLLLSSFPPFSRSLLYYMYILVSTTDSG